MISKITQGFCFPKRYLDKLIGPYLILWMSFSFSSCGDPRTTGYEIEPGMATKSAQTVRVWQPFELAIGSSIVGTNPYVDGPSLIAQFTGTDGDAIGKTLLINGFWDGGNVWLLRFTPTAEGNWRYETRSDDPAMNGLTGNVTANRASFEEKSKNRLLGGFLETSGNAWQLSDGDQFFPVGDSQWSLLEEFSVDELKAWLDVLKKLDLTTLHGTVWLAIYTRSDLAPFVNRDPKSDLLNPLYFQALDDVIRYANERGIILGLAIGGFPDNSRWFEQFGDQERHDRWFRYIIDRYSAYNVRWLLFGEINEVAAPWFDGWEETGKYYAELVKNRDPYKHPLGSHHTTVDISAAIDTNIDYIEVQTNLMGLGLQPDQQYLILQQYMQWSKPLWVEEYWYEPQVYDVDVGIGIRNTHQNFIAALAFPTMGGLMRAHSKHADFAPSMALQHSIPLATYLLQFDTGLKRLSEFKAFYEKLDLRNYQYWKEGCNRTFCAKFGSEYAIFLPNGGAVEIDLSTATGAYMVRGLDVLSGKTLEVGIIKAGCIQRIDSGLETDVALSLTRINNSEF